MKLVLSLFIACSVAGCAGGGGIAGGGVRRVDLASIDVDASIPPTGAKRARIYLVVGPMPEQLTMKVLEMLPGQVSFLRAPRVLGTVEVENLRSALVGRVRAGLAEAFTQVEEGGTPQDSDHVAELSFSSMSIEMDAARPPVSEMSISSCTGGGSMAGDLESESTTIFGEIPPAQQHAFLRLRAHLVLSRGFSSASGGGGQMSETLALDANSDGIRAPEADPERMIQQALHRGFTRAWDYLPVALRRLDEPAKSIEELWREVCSERGVKATTGL